MINRQFVFWRPVVFCSLIALLFCAQAPEGLAATRKKAKAEQHQTTISSVTPTAITITQDNQTKTYQISPLAEVSINGQKAAIADLKPGMTVDVVLSDPTRVSRITAMSK
jgi:hypothetical protein